MNSCLAILVEGNSHCIVEIPNPGPVATPKLVQYLWSPILISENENNQFAHGFDSYFEKPLLVPVGAR